MFDEVSGVVERLAEEFKAIDSMVIMETVCTCSDECESASPYFVEHAARACLSARAQHDLRDVPALSVLPSTSPPVERLPETG